MTTVRPRAAAAIRRGTALAALMLGMSAAVAPAGVEAQVGPAGQFSITPARRDIVGRPPIALQPTVVANATRATLDVRVYPVLLRQQLSGAFDFSTKRRDLATAARIVNTGAGRFVMAPGTAREIPVRWAMLPRRAKAAYVGLVFESRVRERGGRRIRQVNRLLSVNFLRLPGRFAVRGAFSWLRATQAGPRRLRLFPRIRNTGEVIAAPTSFSLRIRDATGRTVVRRSIAGDVVLPRAWREFPVEIGRDTLLPAGRYRAIAAMRFGDSKRRRVESSFRLVGPNELPSPQVALRSFDGKAEIGKTARAVGEVRSVGTAPASTVVRLRLYRLSLGAPAGGPLATKVVRFDRLAPGERRKLDVRLTRVPDGAYRVVASYDTGPGVSDRLTADFEPVQSRGVSERVQRWVVDHAFLLMAIAAMAGLMVVSAAYQRSRRRMRERIERLEREAERGPRPRDRDVV